MTATDLIVIGGGAVGSAIAWGAAVRGAAVLMLNEGDTAPSGIAGRTVGSADVAVIGSWLPRAVSLRIGMR